MIAFMMLGISIVPISEIKQRIPSAKHRKSLDVRLLKDILYLLLCVVEPFGIMGIYIAFTYVQLYAL